MISVLGLVIKVPLLSTMHSIPFSPIIDLPLAGILLVAFTFNSWLWANANNAEVGVDLLARLPMALRRFFLFFFGLLTFCWLCNIGLWAVAAILIVIGIVFTIFAGSNSFAPEIMLVATAGLLREWAFGFPTLILSPPTRSQATTDGRDHELVGAVGLTTSPLRPSGEIVIDSNEHAAISDNGTFIESGTEVVVVAFKNGRTRVVLANLQ